jgi:DNA polymerase I-like protein with 3'-5' exonuclease and polymerase domains
MTNLFDLIASPPNASDWKPQDPPILDGIHDIEIDFETTGLRWWAGDRPIGAAVRTPDGVCRYLPWGHRGGGNLDENVVKRWFHEQVKHKRITNIKTDFEVHMAREWGVDLEAQGNEVSDVAHYAALLDDHRKRFNLNILANDYLGKSKVGMDLDAKRMASYHAGEVAPRAESDVRLVGELKAAMWPLLDDQDLQRVRALEDEVIYPVCEMEKNAAPLDVPLLNEWLLETKVEQNRLLAEIAHEVHFQMNPDSPKDWAKLFKFYKIPVEQYTKGGQPSFTDLVLKNIPNEVVQKGRRAGKFASLRSKYFVPYAEAVKEDGLLRFHLNQLRSDDKGTVTGRFSSSDKNIQQVMTTEKQTAAFESEKYLVRQLFIAGEGLFLSADAMQIEYRIFADMAKNPAVLAAYKRDPYMSFHKFVHELIKVYKPDLSYRRCKDCNFATIYGAGLLKLALMLEFITAAQYLRLLVEYPKGVPPDHPLLAEALEVKKVYNKALPEAQSVGRAASKIAKERGYVRDLLGRRSRFINGERAHKALNSIIQPGAATIMKRKLVDLHKQRKRTGFKMRMTVHDEVCGDVHDQEAAALVKELLNEQAFPEMQVPILWDVKTGPNWAEC